MQGLKMFSVGVGQSQLILLPRVAFLLIFGLAVLVEREGVSQVIQLPNRTTFALETSLLVPDGGSTFGGGTAARAAAAARTRGGQSFEGLSRAGRIDVRAEIIDLDEIDRLLRESAIPPRYSHRAVARSKSKGLDEQAVAAARQRLDELEERNKSERTGRSSAESLRTENLRRNQQPHYDYLLALTHPEAAVDSHRHQSREDLQYFLDQATIARRNGRWESVRVFYQLAWKSLSDLERERLLRSLASNRADLASEAESKPIRPLATQRSDSN